MKSNKDKTKEQLTEELEELRQRIAELEVADTERKKMEKALRESEEKYRKIVGNVRDMVYSLYPDGTLYFVSPNVLSLAGYKPEEGIGHNIMEFIHPDDREHVLADFEKTIKTGEEFPTIFRFSRKDGSYFYAEELGRVLRDGGKVVGITGVVRDITERKQVEEELEKYRDHLEELVEKRTNDLEARTTELKEASIHLQEIDRLKWVFLANMSHELRTPLNSIIGFMSIILQGMSGEINEEQRKQLTMARKSASHLMSLISDVLDMSKIEAGKVDLSPEEFSLDDLVREAVESLSPTASAKGLELTMEVPEGITLFSDKKRVKQVLMNLLSNAVKFTDQGSVKISARVPGDDNLELRVTDTGVGIKEENMNMLFQPFQQVDVSLTKKNEGTGLGLYLIKKLLILFGGYISAKSQYGKGSEFTFTIPLKYEEEPRNEANTGS